MNEPLDLEPIKASWAKWEAAGLPPVSGDRRRLMDEVERLRQISQHLGWRSCLCPCHAGVS
jgi:hypothetical protein